MEPFNFNELPEVVRLLFEKVELIEQIVTGLKTPDKEDDLLDADGAAGFLKISKAALYTKVSRKEIRFYKPGKRLYFNRKDLQEWINAGKRKTAQEFRTEADFHTNRFVRNAR
ncbi:helix-turn-helix domain-containing protein [Mucilaginibacter sp. HD30]